MVDSVRQLETNLVSSPADDAEAHRLCFAVAKVELAPDSVSLPEPPVLRRPLPLRLCEVVCLYRLVDVLYDLQERDTLLPFENPTYPKHRVSKFLPTQVSSTIDSMHIMLVDRAF